MYLIVTDTQIFHSTFVMNAAAKYQRGSEERVQEAGCWTPFLHFLDEALENADVAENTTRVLHIEIHIQSLKSGSI